MSPGSPGRQMPGRCCDREDPGTSPGNSTYLAVMEIHHDTGARRFHFSLPEGSGELTYEEPEPGVLELDHTWVDPEIRGLGHGDTLAKAALDWARAEGKRVIPLCPFVRHYIDRHPAEKELLRH